MAEPGEGPIAQAFNLYGRVAVVTGAAGLLGKMHCNALASAGANIIAGDMKQRECEELVHQVQKTYEVRAISIDTDITSADQVCDLKKMVLADFGHIDILVNNAGLNDAVEASG